MTASERRHAILFGLVLCLCGRLPAQQANETPSQASPFKIEVKVNSVLVPVVVRDAQGRSVGDLKQQDFQLFDQDKPQIISGFTIQRRTAIEDRVPTVEGGISSPAPTTPGAPSTGIPARFVVFLFDDMHLEPGDLLRIKKVATKMLAESLNDSDMAAVVTTSGVNSGLTRDRAALLSAVMKVSAHPMYQHDSHACPNIDVYQADLIVNKHDDRALQLGEADYSTCAHIGGETNGSQSKLAVPTAGERMVRAAAAQILAIGDQDVAVTLSTFKEVIQRMGKLPGQHTLILISPGFLTVTHDAMREKSDVLDLAARSNVNISSLDARGLYTTNIDASDRGGTSTMDLMTGQHSEYHGESMNLSEDVMAEFANGTGGTFFHNSNDLEGGFKNLAQTPEYVYLLEMSLDNARGDGLYHRLKVKVNRSGLKLEARRGYFAPKADRLDARSKAPATKPAAAVAPAQPSVALLATVTAPPVADLRRKDTEKKAKSNDEFWYPLDVDAPLRADTSSSACALSDALEQSAARAKELVTNLQNFTAQEKIEYRSFRDATTLLENRAGLFDYTVVLQQGLGGFSAQETRTPERGTQVFPASNQDIGLSMLALIFLSDFQMEYEMKCDGVEEWKGQRAWVVHFQQRKDRTSHTVLFKAKDVAYPAKIKGRAWIVQDSGPDLGEVIHMETSVMDSIPAANVRRMYLSIDYAPVQFRTQDVRVWLPQAVDAYGDFGDHRTIVNHTFTKFLLYSVRTDDVIGKPANR
jgi:VWFA-related protein